MDEILVTPPFGTFALTPGEARIIALTRAMPSGAIGKRLALWLRKLVKGAMGRPIDTEVFGLRMRLDGQRNIAERRLLIQPQHFDPQERAALAEVLRPGDVAVDVGANVGAYSLFMARYVGTEGRVLACEPQPQVLERLRVNVQLNPELPIEIIAKAVGAHAGTVEFQLGTGNQGEGRIAEAGAHDGVVTVPIAPLAQLLDERGIAAVRALKIDVEGAEPSVLVPFFEMAPRAQWPQLIVMEHGNPRWTLDLTAHVCSKGYKVGGQTRLNVLLERAT